MKEYEDYNEDTYLHSLYGNLTGLGIILHLAYAIIFIIMKIPYAYMYNFLSVLFYIMMLLIVLKKQAYSLVVSLIHLECGLFVVTHTMLFGWDATFYMFLISMASLVYFCPYRNMYIPYVFSLFYFCEFFMLNTYFHHYGSIIAMDESVIKLFFTCNCISSFIIILYVAYVSKAYAVVGRKELISQNRSLQRLANYDQLTGLYSRHYLKERFSAMPLQEGMLAIGDIDDFKIINDTYGHICGDSILCELAEQMRKFFSKEVILCRWGGEEFVLIFPDSQASTAKAQLDKFCCKVEQFSFLYEQRQIHITLTFGLYKKKSEISLEKWIEEADKLLYLGKRKGKNRVIINQAEI